MLLGGMSSLCPRALWDVWLDAVNKEAGPVSVKVPMLETDACVTESEAGLTDTAEPAAAGERQKIQSQCDWKKSFSDNFNNAFRGKEKKKRAL